MPKSIYIKDYLFHWKRWSPWQSYKYFAVSILCSQVLILQGKCRTPLIAHSVPEITIIHHQSITFALNRITWSNHFWKVKVFHNEVFILWSFLLSYFPPDILGNSEMVGILCFREWMPEFPEGTNTKSSDCCTESFISPHILFCLFLLKQQFGTCLSLTLSKMLRQPRGFCSRKTD